MSALFNIFGTPPTPEQIDAARVRAERTLRLTRRLKQPLTAMAFVLTGSACLALLGIITDEHLLQRFIISVFCGLLAAACVVEVMYELGETSIKDIGALCDADRFLKEQTVKMANERPEIERYLHALGQSRSMTRGEYELLKQFARTPAIPVRERQGEAGPRRWRRVA